jgi:hypothetical protein
MFLPEHKVAKQHRVEAYLLVEESDGVHHLRSETGAADFFLSASQSECSGEPGHAGPRWRLPIAGSHLCSEWIGLQPTGVIEALQRYHGELHPRFFVDSKPIRIDLERGLNGEGAVYILPASKLVWSIIL